MILFNWGEVKKSVYCVKTEALKSMHSLKQQGVHNPAKRNPEADAKKKRQEITDNNPQSTGFDRPA